MCIRGPVSVSCPANAQGPAPSLHRHDPVSPVLRAGPSSCRPGRTRPIGTGCRFGPYINPAQPPPGRPALSHSPSSIADSGGPTPIPRRVPVMLTLLSSQPVPDVPIFTEGRHTHDPPQSRPRVPSYPRETARPAGSLNRQRPSFYPQGFTPCRSLSDPPLRTSRSHPTAATLVGRDLHPPGECTLSRRTLKMGYEYHRKSIDHQL